MTGEEKAKAGMGIGIIVFMIVIALIIKNKPSNKNLVKTSVSFQTKEIANPTEKPKTEAIMEATKESVEQTDEERYEASQNVEIGDTCILNGGGSMNIIGTNYEDLKALDKAAIAGDEQAVIEMYYQGRAFAVPSGTKVLFIDSSWAGRKIRILEGDYKGKSGWVSRDYIQPVN